MAEQFDQAKRFIRICRIGFIHQLDRISPAYRHSARGTHLREGGERHAQQFQVIVKIAKNMYYIAVFHVFYQS